jgi:hypothetical protein
MLWGIWLVSIFIAAIIGGTRGSPVGGALLGIFLGPIGVLAAFGLRSTKVAKCPMCKEWIQKDAVKCPRCQSTLEPTWAARL